VVSDSALPSAPKEEAAAVTASTLSSSSSSSLSPPQIAVEEAAKEDGDLEIIVNVAGNSSGEEEGEEGSVKAAAAEGTDKRTGHIKGKGKSRPRAKQGILQHPVDVVEENMAEDTTISTSTSASSTNTNEEGSLDEGEEGEGQEEGGEAGGGGGGKKTAKGKPKPYSYSKGDLAKAVGEWRSRYKAKGQKGTVAFSANEFVSFLSKDKPHVPNKQKAVGAALSRAVKKQLKPDEVKAFKDIK